MTEYEELYRDYAGPVLNSWAFERHHRLPIIVCKTDKHDWYEIEKVERLKQLMKGKQYE